MAGTISSAALAGQIYYKEMQAYEDYQKKELDVIALKNIYIDSAVPIELKQTNGEAYVEFNQRFASIIKEAPTYKLDVQTREDTTYITVNQEKDIDVCFMVRENTALCSLYLPQEAIDKLVINNDMRNYWMNNNHNIAINLNKMDVKDLQISSNETKILLDGAYEKVKVSGNGSLTMHSTIPAQVQLEGNIAGELTGQYHKVQLEEWGNQISIDSAIPTEVWAKGGRGNLKLTGNYTKVDVQGQQDGTIDIRSNSLCKANIDHAFGSTYLEGAFQDVLVYSREGDVAINSTVLPDKLSLLGNANKISLLLPSNLEGLEVTYNPSYFESNQEPISDFLLQREDIGNQARKYTFGDLSTKILVEASESNKFYILDNGYISRGQSDHQETQNTEGIKATESKTEPQNIEDIKTTESKEKPAE